MERVELLRATLTEDGVTAAKKLFHVLVMNVRGPALVTDENGALAWRALITRYVTEHSAESTKSHERHPQCEDLSLSAHSL